MLTTKENDVQSKSNKRQVIDTIIDFLAGVAGGTASVYVGQPLDTVKVKMQTFPELYPNGYRCFVTTLKTEGIVRGLYAGTVPSLAAQVSENAVLFMAYGMCQKTMALLCQKQTVSELNVIENGLSGSMAAFFAAFALCPTELIKCKLQAMKEMRTEAAKRGVVDASLAHIGPLKLTQRILREEGLRGMFQGLVPTFAREMPGYFFFFGGYEICRTLLTPAGKTKDDLSPVRTVICGGMGGMALWTAVFPADVIKSRVQVQGSARSAKNPSFFVMMLQIMRQEGIRALYKGLGPTLLRTFPATGALFLAVEETKKGLGRLADRADIF